ncbi:hypothetical protein MPER_10967 [Moniliophthora perniciosa FA553]|nr:hypothetical protein MPER_10967 [Moniliophthora perniciosa FA553]
MQGIDDLVLRTMDMDMKQVRQHTQWCPQAFFILAEYREKWKACHMKYMDVIIQSDLVHSSRAPETGRIIFSIMLGTPFPTTVALDAAMEVAKKTMGDQASFGWPTDWIAKLRTVIRQFPVWNDLDSR